MEKKYLYSSTALDWPTGYMNGAKNALTGYKKADHAHMLILPSDGLFWAKKSEFESCRMKELGVVQTVESISILHDVRVLVQKLVPALLECSAKK